MSEEQLYKLVQLDTTGWQVVIHGGHPVEGMNRNEIKEIIQNVINEGENPNRLKIVLNDVSLDELPSL